MKGDTTNNNNNNNDNIKEAERSNPPMSSDMNLMDSAESPPPSASITLSVAAVPLATCNYQSVKVFQPPGSPGLLCCDVCVSARQHPAAAAAATATAADLHV